MTSHTRIRGNLHRRRAVAAVQVGVMTVVLLGFAALTVDLGNLYNARADLQHAADAAALAGASAYVTDEMMQIRMETGNADTLVYVTGLAATRVNEFAERNPTIGLSTSAVASGDIKTGWINLNSATDAIQTSPAPADFNAVQVTVRREAGEEGGGNGPVEFFFAPIFGRLAGETSASAVAVFDDRFSTFSAGDEGAGMLPFTIHRAAFASELADGGDQYGYNSDGDTVISAADGIREVRLYPYPLSGSGYEEGDGNFGVLNIGTGNQGVDAEIVQILNGVSPEDFEMEVGTSELTFHDESGNPVTYDMTGSPGLEAALKAPISQIVGQVVGFFLHDNVVLSGSNAIYTITEIRFGRVMDINLTGAPSTRGLYIQPVSYAGGGVHIDPDAPSSGGLVGRLVLAR